MAFPKIHIPILQSIKYLQRYRSVKIGEELEELKSWQTLDYKNILLILQ